MGCKQRFTDPLRSTPMLKIKLQHCGPTWSQLFALLVAVQWLPVSQAFCNCLGPMSNMFKVSKQGASPFGAPPLASSIYGPQVVHPGERASWYPQSQLAAMPMAYGQQNGIKRFNLFQPKWRTGSGLFGPKKWMMDWRMMGSNANFYRPGYGYGYGSWSPSSPPPQVQDPPNAQLLPPSSGSYQYLGDQARLQLQQQQQQQQLQQQSGYGQSGGLYAPRNPSYSTQLNANDGWTALPSGSNMQLPPYNSQQQQLLNYGDSYSTLPAGLSGNLIQPARQSNQSTNNNSYGTKGASGSSNKQQQQQFGNTTKKN